MLTFWTGFASGMAAMLLVTLSIGMWFVIQTANFHNSWLDKKDEKQ